MRFTNLFKIIFAGGAGFLVISAILLYINFLNRDLDVLRSNWQSLIQESQTVTSHLNRLEQEIGYGGFIHNFKNYVIRKDAKYSIAAVDNLDRAFEELNRLQRLLDDDAQMEQLLKIQKTMHSYAAQLSFAIQRSLTLTTDELDMMVKVDDTPAIKALEFLNKSLRTNLSDQSGNLEKAIGQVQDEVNSGYWLVVIVIVATAFLIIQFISLESARLRAETSEKTRSEFLASMSHEIRTPLAGIRGIAGMMEETTSKEDNNLHLKKIVTLVDSLRSLLDDILDLSKLDAGKIKLEALVFSPAHLTNEVVDLFYRSTPNSKLEDLIISCRVNGKIPDHIKSDPSRLRQILLNLVGNAVKFTEKGEVAVILSALDNKLSVEVKDTGIGIEPDKLNRLFKDFSQADASISRRYQGTGLGLSISKRLVELMGGEISVESVAGQGSSFKFFIPFTLPNEDEVSAVSQEEEKHDHYSASRPLKILVAEDNHINQTIISHILENLGHEFVLASDGAEAIDAFKVGEFDIALLDIRMPNVSGVEVARFIRSTSSPQSAIPIVAVTADVISENLEAYTEAGINEFVAKPIEVSSLVNTIDKCMGQKIHRSADDQDAQEEQTPVADLSAIAEELHLPEEVIQSLMAELDSLLEKFVQNIGGYIADKAIKEIKFDAHAIKGASAALTFVDLSEVFVAIETACDSDDMAEVERLVEKVKEGQEEVRALL